MALLPQGLWPESSVGMANTWVEAFIQGKWLNSTNNIVELKCPNPTGGGVLFFHV